MDPGKEEKKEGLISWIAHRFHFQPIGKHVVYHRIARVPWYFGGGTSLLMLLTILVFTGLFLALAYSPSPSTAYESVIAFTHNSALGWFVRALHYWSAGMMVVMLLYHVLRQIILGGYLPPREGIWLVGVLLFFLVIAASFSGYVLRWDEKAIYGLRIALNIFHKVPWIGDQLVVFVQGGEEISASTLSRLFAFHALFLPFTMGLLVAYHLYLVIHFGATTALEQKYGPGSAEEQMALSDFEKKSPRLGEDFFPHAVSKSGAFAMAVFVLVLVLSLTKGPAPLSPEANFVRVSEPEEEWWFQWYSSAAALLPPALAHYFHWLFPLALFAVMAALPFLDQDRNRGAKRRPLAIISAALVVTVVLALTGLRSRSPWTAWPRTEPPPVPEGAEMTPPVERGRQLFVAYGCYNCHGIGGNGSSFGPNLTGIEARLSQDELRSYILQPPAGIPMPAYGNRMPDGDLQAVVAYVLAAQTYPREFP